MEPVEINAGTYYLRQLRADDRMDDRPALIEAFADAATQRYRSARVPDSDAATAYVRDREAAWESDTRYTWVVAEQTTGALLAEVELNRLDPANRAAGLAFWTHPAHRGGGVLVPSIGAVLRFASGALGMHRTELRHVASNHAARRVAEKCGFTLDGTLREAAVVDGTTEDLLIWSRLSTDS
ncbi:GNAT family N-acetyltransferase [Haloechinothrix sp. LS1_15]|uniref:GNAT family N-acetyltransferase n=1 Tax=Haloechinothrix sp. LS1_15 TaxID=2652248 RepID=UPI0029445271|nr:GNAT family N-acetyltransferase [Haloechinothrix sp. LS1_15]MDV6012958.1 GNAT family N-acetyltransferase [Haloechinothrix sp. LS1_15]